MMDQFSSLPSTYMLVRRISYRHYSRSIVESYMYIEKTSKTAAISPAKWKHIQVYICMCTCTLHMHIWHASITQTCRHLLGLGILRLRQGYQPMTNCFAYSRICIFYGEQMLLCQQCNIALHDIEHSTKYICMCICIVLMWTKYTC